MKIKWETWPVDGEKWDCISLDAEGVGRTAEIMPDRRGYLLRKFIGEGEADRTVFKTLKAAKANGEKWMGKELKVIMVKLKKFL